MADTKTELEKYAEKGLHGDFEFKKGERSRFLGEYRERVIKALTAEQVEEPGVYPQIMEALRDPRASKLIIRRDIDMDRARDYIKLANERNVAFKRVDAPSLKGDIGLVVVSSRAVDEPDILIPQREERLKELGLSEELIHAIGEKVCADCWNEIETLAPEELENYQRISWIEGVLGTKCAACGE